MKEGGFDAVGPLSRDRNSIITSHINFSRKAVVATPWNHYNLFIVGKLADDDSVAESIMKSTDHYRVCEIPDPQGQKYLPFSERRTLVNRGDRLGGNHSIGKDALRTGCISVSQAVHSKPE